MKMEKHKIYNTFKATYMLKVMHERSALLPTAAPAHYPDQ
jgi:hypothetical protein